MKKKIIGVDFDDVLFNFNRSFVDFCNKKYGTKMTYEKITDYMMEKSWNEPIEVILKRIEEFFKSGEHDLVIPLAGSEDAIKSLSSKYDLVVITSRPDLIKESTNRWINKNFGDVFKGVHFSNQFMTGGGVARKKSEICKEIGVNLFIEDAPVYSMNIAKNGIPVILLNTPYNQNVSHELISRVNSWAEVEGKIGEILG